ncbi:MAG TPA: WecB/TagA/CpsF family glycosyltransferase [Verrucomicrobiae bacterium]|nr:WecB/TagA/CpsF family glycosyltransferase [Verrucomicrobiae bacterium]
MLTNEFITGGQAYFESDEYVRLKRSRSSPPSIAPPIVMLGVAFDNVNLQGTVARIDEMISARTPRYIVTANVDFLVQSRRDAELRRILLDAHLVLCDGMPLIWASRLLGNPLPERVAGSDLVPELIRLAAKKNHRLFFLGATPEANAQAIANVRKQFPSMVVGGYSPPFRPLAEMDNEEIAKRIRAVRPDIMLVSFGCPKAEKWIAANIHSLGVPVMIGVGATIDFLAGRVRRAPLWMQRAGVEWLFRVWQEPRRLSRRYFTDLWPFGCAMAAQLWRMENYFRRTTIKEFCSLAASEPAWRRIRTPRKFDAKVVEHDQWVLEVVDNRHCLLDMADTDFIDSTGIGLLLQLRKKMQSAGKKLVLMGLNRALKRALELMCVDKYFLIAASAVEARKLMEEPLRKPDTACESGLNVSLSGVTA